MRILIPGSNWRGGMEKYLGLSFKDKNHDVDYIFFPSDNKSFLKKTKLTQLIKVNKYVSQKIYNDYNKSVIIKAKSWKPDLIFTMNGARLLPETVKYLKEELNCTTICYVADNPFDSSRDKYVGMSLRHYNYIFVCEKMWIQNIQNVSPESKVFSIGVGFDPNIFDANLNPILPSNEELECDISFTGANYGEKAEGAYRAGILAQLTNYKLKIWGHGNWPSRFKYFPELKYAYQGDLLPFNKLLELYLVSKINLNMPSPQILTGFQPRVFEIAAAKGFQIIDFRNDLLDYFSEDEIVTFRNPFELKEKINFYLNNNNARLEIVNNLYNKVINKYSWNNVASNILDIID